VSETPRGAENFDPQRFLGTWHILVTNYGFWRSRINPTVTYEAMADQNGKRAWRDTLRFGKRGLFGGDFRPATLAGVDVELESARFLWRGDGLLTIIKSPWWLLIVDAEHTWAVTYFGRSNVGTAPGMDIYARSPDIAPAKIAEILTQVRAHPFLKSRCDNLYATVQGTLATDRYILG